MSASASETVVPRTGSFRYDARTKDLTWSETTYEVFGRALDEPPTLAALVEYVHPDDRAKSESIIVGVLQDGGRCSYAHRILRGDQTRHVVVVGDAEVEDSCADDSTVVAVAGFVIDITEHLDRAVAHRLGLALSDIVDARAEIEQAKGILMLAFGVDANKAFDVLAWQSQTHNVKVRDLAAQIVCDVRGTEVLAKSERDSVGTLLLSAHERIPRRQ